MRTSCGSASMSRAATVIFSKTEIAAMIRVSITPPCIARKSVLREILRTLLTARTMTMQRAANKDAATMATLSGDEFATAHSAATHTNTIGSCNHNSSFVCPEFQRIGVEMLHTNRKGMTNAKGVKN